MRRKGGARNPRHLSLVALMILSLLFHVLGFQNILSSDFSEYGKNCDLSEARCNALSTVRREGQVSKIIYFHLTKSGGNTVDGVLKEEAESRGIPFTNIRFSNEVASLNVSAQVPAIYTTEVWHHSWRRKFADAGFSKFTVIRDPLTRALSWFYFRRADPRPKYNHFKRISVQYFLRDKTYHNYYLRAFQTRWPFRQALQASKLGSQLYSYSPNDVMQMMEREFVLVGLLKRMPESMYAFRRLFGLNTSKTFFSQNMHRGRPNRSVLSVADVNTFKRYNRADIAIYKHAQVLFNRTMQLFRNDDKLLETLSAQREIQDLGCAGGGRVAGVGGREIGESRAGGCMTFRT